MVVGVGPRPPADSAARTSSPSFSVPLPGSRPCAYPWEGNDPSVLSAAVSPWSPGPPRPGVGIPMARIRLIEPISCWSVWLVRTWRRNNTVVAPVRTLTTKKRTSIDATSLLRSVHEPGLAQRGRDVRADPVAGSVTASGWSGSTSAASCRSARRLEDIPHASHGVDHRLTAGVDLLAQVGDVELHDVGLAAEVVVPDAVEDLRLGQHPLGVAHEVAQQLELGGRQLDRRTAAGDLVAVLVEGEVADDDDRVLVLRGDDGGAAHERAKPGDDLLEAERLGDVVVAARGQPGDAVLDGVARREEEDRDALVVLAHPAEHLHTVHVRKHHVECHRVGLELTSRTDRGHAAAGRPDLPALVAQRHAQQLGEVVLVVDDEHPRRGAVGAHELLGAGRERVHVLTVTRLSWRAVCRCYAFPVGALWWRASSDRARPAPRYLHHRFVTAAEGSLLSCLPSCPARR